MKVIKYLQPGKKKGRLRPGRSFRWWLRDVAAAGALRYGKSSERH